MNPDREPPPDIAFRSAAAPGLDEDDLFAALMGLPGTGALWGEALPPTGAAQEAWDDERERRRRHEELLRRWRPLEPPGSG